MPSWLRPGGMEVDVLVVDETELEPMVTVRIIATGEERIVPIGKISSSEGDLSVYREANEVIRE